VSQEQLYGAIFAVIGAIIGTLWAINRLIEARAKQMIANADSQRLNSEREKAETDTENYVVKKISDEFSDTNAENRALNRRLRECEVEQAEIRALSDSRWRLVQEKNAQIETQSKLLREAAASLSEKERSIKAKDELIALQENKIRGYELRLADMDKGDRDV